MEKFIHNLAISGLLWGVAASSYAATYSYELVKYPGASSTTIRAISDAGTAVGSYTITDGTSYKTIGFIYDNGRFQSLPSAGTCTRPAGYGVPETTYDITVNPLGINASGEIVGSTNACGRSRGFILTGNTYKQIHWSGANSSAVSGINNNGISVGNYQLPTLRTGAFTYQNSYKQSFYYPEAGVRLSLADINDAGYMLGSFSEYPWDGGDEFIYDPFTYQFTDFVIPNVEPLSSVSAFNDMGQIIGVNVTNDGADRKGYVYDSVSGFSVIDVPESNWTIPADINNSGIIVGHFSGTPLGSGSFIATPDVAPTAIALPLPVDTYVPPVINLNAPVAAELGAEGVNDYIAGDFNGGGAADLMVAHGDGKVAVYFGENIEEGLFNDAEKLPAIAAWGGMVYSIEAGDFNNDGFLDVFLNANQCDGNVTNSPVMLGVGDGTFIPAPCISKTESISYNDTYLSGSGVADVNEDGNDDIIISITGNYGEKGIFLYLGNGDGTFMDRQTVSTVNRTSKLAVGDFDDDGHIDLLSRTTDIEFYKGDGAGNFTSALFSGRWPGEQVDINSDSYPDEITTKDGKTVIYPGNPDGEFNYTPQIFDLLFPDTRLIADFNADGLLDIVKLNGPLGGNAEAVLYTQAGAAVDQPVDPAPEPTPDPVPAPAPVSGDTGDVPAIEPDAIEDYEFSGIISEVGSSYVVIDGVKTWYTSTTEITTEGDVPFAIGMEAQAQGWLNPDGEVIAVVLEAW